MPGQAGSRGRAVRDRSSPEERFRALVLNSWDVIALMDAAGTFRYVSPSVTGISGFEPDELVGAAAWDFLHPDDLPLATAELADTLAGGPAAKSIELRARRKDGTWMWIEVRAHNRLDDPDLNGIVLNYHDVTDRRRLEEQLTQAQKMEAVGRLAGGVAHDFNNLLAVILNYVDLVRTDLPDGDRRRADLDQVFDAASRGSELVQQLLTVARQEGAETAAESVPVGERVLGMRRLLQKILTERIGLSIEVSSEAAAGISPIHLDQVLMNLVINARDAIADPGKVTIEVADFRHEGAALPAIADLASGRFVRLSVTDTGRGMDDETRRRIFEPFYTTKTDGSGLGLAIAYALVSRAGGLITAYSELGLGTTFHVYLPVVDDGGGEVDLRADDEAGSPDGPTILVVEDEERVRLMIERVLRREGYRVLGAGGGVAALTCLADEAVDLVLSDVVLPDVPAGTLAREVVATPMLFMSGYPEEVVRERGLAPGDAHLLQKPFNPEELRASIAEALRREG